MSKPRKLRSPATVEKAKRAREIAMRFAHKIHKPSNRTIEDSPRTPSEKLAILHHCQLEFNNSMLTTNVVLVNYARTLLNILEDRKCCDLNNLTVAENMKELVTHLLDVFHTLGLAGKTADKVDVCFKLQSKLDELINICSVNQF